MCAQKLRKWQRQGVSVSLLDLQNAYLQIHVDKALWLFQTVIFRGSALLSYMVEFGLNVVPLMKSVIDTIVSQEHTIKSATSAYVDDILINETLVPVSHVQHFLDYGLVSKDPARQRWSQSSWLKSLGKEWHSPMEVRKLNSGNPWWINPSAHIFSLRETCWSLPRMWMAQGGSCIYQAPANCSKKGLGW